jgi:hypothetical protein
VTLPVHAPEHLAAGFELLEAVCPEVDFRVCAKTEKLKLKIKTSKKAVNLWNEQLNEFDMITSPSSRLTRRVKNVLT